MSYDEVDRLVELIEDHQEDWLERVMDRFHSLQLMCMEEMGCAVAPCGCHGAGLRRTGMCLSRHRSGVLSAYLWSRLELDLSVGGVYFVTMWAAPQFAEFNPVYMSKPESGVMGMMIHVPVEDRAPFVGAVAALGELGTVPCHYLRKIFVTPDQTHLHLLPEPWFGEVCTLVYVWQKGEMDALREREMEME